jgi:hypothetical protein
MAPTAELDIGVHIRTDTTIAEMTPPPALKAECLKKTIPRLASEGTMRPKPHTTTGSADPV